ncbi:hypothetical protein N7474_006928 [Penicillium riverlandense]|uniref:uncharacterized protein n=1 Tax=Penicillium riverlandense TaxID=1903569 RepID=UPI002548A0BE|nr:uncharacterized protein N7474_006928 [Penicillium riverlandense]KAJ5815151.1 hypothetical protein N7474_006928 [Penicillium riverlandense]
MSKLSQKHQFRLERKYRRRAALKYARPKFIKGVTLAQWVIIGSSGARLLQCPRCIFQSSPPNPVRRTAENNSSASRSDSQ